MEFRVLGPLEASIAGEPVGLGGAKQRSLLATLLLRAGEVVPLARLIDEIWGENPPPSAAHSLEAYVSRLRQLFNGHGPELVRRGSGYSLELGGATLDAHLFVELAGEVSSAAAEDDAATAARVAGDALALWRGPALAGVALGTAGRADAERLEELRLRVLEQDVDAELGLGRHEAVVGELQALVGQNPYRERFVAQLMLALYRSGRHADALDVYERTRIALDDELGLQPSAELQQLSGRIVRQDPELRRPPPVAKRVPGRPVGERKRSVAGLLGTGAATIVAMALSASGSGAQAHVSPALDRMAVVLPGFGSEAELDAGARSVALEARNAEYLYDVTSENVYIDGETAVGDAARRLEAGGFGVAVVAGSGSTAKAFARLVPEMRQTHFVFLDASLRDLSLENVRNASAIRFAEEDSAYLAGYLSGLSGPKDGSRRVIDAVSVVAGVPDARTRNVVAAYVRGVRNAVRGANVYVDYSRELDDPTSCEALANRRIDMGADVVFSAAGRCGLGALAVARFRGVWGTGASEDVEVSSHILTVTTKDWTRAAREAMYGLVFETLPRGRDLVLGLEDDYAVALQMSHAVPDRVESRVIHRCSEIRASRWSDPTS
jgi:DNA-binding SARP family transcriptional activator/basic membrane lipoprotein Med (substrate-binding protein (PBP1-ABC) superfamily)